MMRFRRWLISAWKLELKESILHEGGKGKGDAMGKMTVSPKLVCLASTGVSRASGRSSRRL